MGYASEKRDYRTRDKVIGFDVAGEVRGGQSHLLLVLQEIHFFLRGLPS
jgi:hypothetical protein